MERGQRPRAEGEGGKGVSRCAHITDAQLLQELHERFARNQANLDELRKANTELLALNKKLEESEALKSHFISNITNEIINPFTSILGLSRAILTVDKEAWKKVISMVALIHSEAFSLDFQFRNIFFAARIEAGQEHPEVLNVDIRALIETVIDSFKFELRKKRSRINPIDNLPPVKEGTPFQFKTDPAYLKLLLANLLNNALTYSIEGEPIDLQLDLVEGKLHIRVRDYGIGIPEERAAAIFDRFSRGEAVINSVDRGHGLGLSVCRALIDLLGGEISLQSELGNGTTFLIQIPESEKLAEGLAIEPNEIFFNEEEETF